MKDQPVSETEHRGGWPWLGFFLALAILPLFRTSSSWESLASLGLLLLGVFAYFNNPMQLAQRPINTLTWPHKLSYACGLTGVAVFIFAALKPLL